MIRNCIICDKPFEANGKSVTCSDECKLKRRRQTQRNHALKTEKFTLKTKICVICGKEFTTYRDKEKTCSKECSKKLNLKHISEFNDIHKDERNKKRREKYNCQIESENRREICPVCGKVFDKKHKQKFCSEECRNVKKREYNTNYVREKRKGISK
jgi:predicted nucleic acid-binding Zn ribbon protein